MAGPIVAARSLGGMRESVASNRRGTAQLLLDTGWIEYTCSLSPDPQAFWTCLLMRCLVVADLHYSLPQFDWLLAAAPNFERASRAGVTQLLDPFEGEGADAYNSLANRLRSLPVRTVLGAVGTAGQRDPGVLDCQDAPRRIGNPHLPADDRPGQPPLRRFVAPLGAIEGPILEDSLDAITKK